MIALKPITNINLKTAIKVAREIFPYEVHKDGFWPEVAYKQSLEEKVPQFRYYLAYSKGKIVGITGHYPPDDTSSEMWLGWFGVRPSCRRKGYGKQILFATAEIIVGFGYMKLFLYSGDREEERNAHKLYLSVGFKQYKKGKVDGQPVLYFKAEI